MTSAVAKPWTREEFLEWEALQDERFEFVDGRVRSMVGATFEHNTIVGNLHVLLRTRIKRPPCRVFFESIKVEIGDDFFYPDLLVVREKMAPRGSVVTNPTLIVEVASPSTRAYDRGRKRAVYELIPSLRYYLLVSQHEPKTELFTRSDQGWGFSEQAGAGAQVRLEALDVVLNLAEIYDGVDFEPRRASGA